MKWNESLVSRTKASESAKEVFGTWDIFWDVSTLNLVEFVARRGNHVAYVKYVPANLENLSESRRAKEFVWHIDYFEQLGDFRSFIEVKNDNRLRKLIAS